MAVLGKLGMMCLAVARMVYIRLSRFRPKVMGVRNEQLIVSLTSYGKRVGRFLPYVVYSLLEQRMLPARILVWLDRDHWNEDNVPWALKQMRRYGVEINFCPDVRSYKKLVYTLPIYRDKVIVTVDDDIYYPRTLLSDLWLAHRQHPNCVCSVIAHKVRIIGSSVLPYKQWEKNLSEAMEGLLLPIGAGGVLYPPMSLHPDVLNVRYLELCPTADDLWFWCHALRKGTGHYCLGTLAERFLLLDRLWYFEKKLNTQNVKGGANDVQLGNLVKEYALLPLMVERMKKYEIV